MEVYSEYCSIRTNLRQGSDKLVPTKTGTMEECFLRQICLSEGSRRADRRHTVSKMRPYGSDCFVYKIVHREPFEEIKSVQNLMSSARMKQSRVRSFQGIVFRLCTR